MVEGVRDKPHLMLGTPLRCCLKCMGQTKNPWPAPMIHESTCKRIGNAKWVMPEDWRDRVAPPS